jgi:rhamnopyranosyl-N-acetylglucosaminyl-diphospho-decaprenol beta-1,3/1,4-galactofuranosyltransferase
MHWQMPRHAGDEDKLMPRVVSVIVTMDRPRELERLLQALERQELRADATIVVENLPRRETAEILARHAAVRHLVSHRNLGGAGGFAFGILAALADGATHVWLMDDDGLPRDPDCLRQLTEAIDKHEADVVAPLILDIEDEQHLAFTYFVKGQRITTRDGMARFPLVRQFAHLFNGTLVRAEAFARFGIPDYRMFLRGDEMDFLHRVRRGGGLIITVTEAGFRHPSGAAETVPIVRGRLHAVMPSDPRKQFHFFRNRGYLIRRHRLAAQALHDILRYSLLFLVVRRGDWRGLQRWCRLTFAGFREDFRSMEHLEGIGEAQPRLPAALSDNLRRGIDDHALR